MNLNIIFLSFNGAIIESAGAKRTFYQASFLNRFESVTYLTPLKNEFNKLFFIPIFFGKWNTFTKLLDLRDRRKKNILIIGTLIEFKHFPYVSFAKILGYKIIFDKVENFQFFKDKMSYSNYFNIKFGLFLERWINFLADGLLVISSKLLDKYKNNNIPILLMPNSISIDKINLSSKQKFNSPVKILYAGTFALKDGVEILVKAFLKLLENYNNDIELHLVGKGSSYNESLIKKIINGNNQVIWHGYVNNDTLEKLLLDSDILTMTRRNSKYAHFGFPFKITEYLTTGNTIIATNIGDVDRFLKDKVTAIITEPNVNAIYKSIEYCLKNKNKAINIGKKGQIDALKGFDIELNGYALYKFLKSI